MPTIKQAASRLKGRHKKKRYSSVRSLKKSPQKRGIVKLSRIMTPRKPNSAKRKVSKVKLSSRFYVTAKIKGRSGFLSKHANVLVRGGRANDLPGVRYTMIKGKLDFSWKERVWRMNGRSKFGIKWDDYMWVVSEYIDKMNTGQVIEEWKR